MRRFALLLIGGLAIAALAGQASALSLGGYSGPITIHLTAWDGGTLYNVSDGTYNAAQLAALTVDPSGTTAQSKAFYTNAGTGANRSDTWGVLRVDQIIMGQAPGTSLYSAGQGGEQIVAIFYGEKDQKLTQTSTGSVISQQIAGTGFQLAFFDYTPYVGTASFTGGPTLGSGSTASPTYQGVTNSANLLWTMRAVPGFNSADSVNSFFSTFNGLDQSEQSFGNLLADMTGTDGVAPADFWGNGPANKMLDTNAIAGAFGNVDVSIAFNAGTNPTNFFERGEWLLQANDPIRTSVAVPEPLTMAGLMLGVGCLARYVRRRK
jgi:hypothetical protein